MSTENFRLNYSKKKFGNGEISLNGFVISDIIRISRKRFSDIIKMIKFIDTNYILLKDKKYECFLELLNAVSFKYRDMNNASFYSVEAVLQYLCGHRAYLIGWINKWHKHNSNQKKIIKIVKKIEICINKIDQCYYIV